jgi:hypothetical protein
MSAVSYTRTEFDRRIGLRITARSLAPRVLPALEALGYTLIDADREEDRTGDAPSAWMVDESRMEEIPSIDDAPDLRLIRLCAPKLQHPADRRIVASIPRPARLGTIYSTLQSTFEGAPRKSPRIRTQLSARCIRRDRRDVGAVLSLSEGGCLLRTTERVRRGARVSLQFALPEYGLVSTRAECRYERRGDSGMEFADPPPDVRHTIAHFVTLQLAEAAVTGQMAPA